MKWDLEQAKRMKDAGVTFKEIGKRYGVDPGTVKNRIDPEYAAFRRQGVNACRRARRGYGDEQMRVSQLRIVRSTPDFVLPPIPPDTRSLTARYCGDPLPGRSALDQRQGPAR